MKGVVFCTETPIRGQNVGATYGCLRRIEDALAALERGRRRGVTWGVLTTRKRAPRGMRMNEWLPPFDDRKAGFR